MPHVQGRETGPEANSESIITPLAPDELTRRNQGLIELLDSWELEGDEEEQRETLAVIREALGPR